MRFIIWFWFRFSSPYRAISCRSSLLTFKIPPIAPVATKLSLSAYVWRFVKFFIAPLASFNHFVSSRFLKTFLFPLHTWFRILDYYCTHNIHKENILFGLSSRNFLSRHIFDILKICHFLSPLLHIVGSLSQ